MRALLTIALALLCARAAEAQSAYHLSFAPGTQVRVSTVQSPRSRFKGTVAYARSDTLMLETRSMTRPFALRDLHSLEIRGGINRKKGMLIGAVIGAALGATSSEERASVAAGSAMMGAVVGFAFAPRGWEALPLPEAAR